jgi:hypothetical protein
MSAPRKPSKAEQLRQSRENRSESAVSGSQQEQPPTEELQTVSIRLTAHDKRALAAHFRRKWDVGLSTGIRFLLKDYMERERL